MHHAISIFNAAIKAVQPQQFIPRCMQWKDGLYIDGKKIDFAGRLLVVAVGKAAAAMASETEKVLNEHINGGLVVTKYKHALPLKHLQIIEAGHPLPDENSVLAATKVKELLDDLQENDLVIVLISGGASALLTDLPDGVTLEILKEIADKLIKSGADIAEINTVRKHLSDLKGGGLAKMAFPAKLYSLILSDVVGNNPDVIGSGLTVPDTSTMAAALNIMEKHQLATYQHLIKETPKPGEEIFHNSHYLLAATNEVALDAAKREAEKLGYHTIILTSAASGLVQDLSMELVQQAIQYKGPMPACLLMGGESTVQVTGKGKGGRNQQFALQAGIALQGHPGITILSGGTDGTDGPTDAAGAMMNTVIMQEAAALRRDAATCLANNNAYHFFENTSGHIMTGPTQTNVMDVMLALIKS
ncbi:DUF4147 domain-containing protein [uncultured Chitinophaga sp.]|uniref:glycerate kinase type-2 family protein n=1 Tax=uncultured Chitinophaga sp. TaxID=339340 RepID=UPI0025F25E77|nr:DUF4147 domain-containing protein [uncultured Chitinophaga sp.]